MNASPITTSTKPAISKLRLLVDGAADRRSRRTEHDEHHGEAGDERDARERDPPPHAALAEPVDVDRRDGRQVARDERQDARRQHREEAREERDGKLLSHRTARARRRSDAPSRSRGAAEPGRRPAGGAPSSAPRRRALRRRAARRRSAAPRPSRSKPCFAGSESTPGPKLATISSMICFFVHPCSDPLADRQLHLLRDRGRSTRRASRGRPGRRARSRSRARSAASPPAGRASTSAASRSAAIFTS